MRFIESICSCLKACSENRSVTLSAPLALLLLLPGAAQAAITAYTDEALYLADLADLGFVSTTPESFEDGDWVAARTVAQPSVTNLGITWSPLDTAPNAGLRTSTGGGDVHDGSYIMFTYEVVNGLPVHSIPDGFTLTANGFPLYGVGGWFQAGTQANLDFIVDGVSRVDFQGAEMVNQTWTFLGFIENDPSLGFSSVEILETDETGDETRIFFSDDFTLAGQAGAFPPAPVPLPAALPLFGTGLLALVGFLGRRGKCT